MRSSSVRRAFVVLATTVLAFVLLTACNSPTDSTSETDDIPDTQPAEPAISSTSNANDEYSVGEPFDMLFGLAHGERRRFDVSVDGPLGLPFALIRFEPAGSDLSMESTELPGVAAEIGPAKCVLEPIDVARGTGEKCFADHEGVAVIVLEDEGTIRISVPCGSTEEFDNMLSELDLFDVVRIAPQGDEEVPRQGPLASPCPGESSS